MCRICCFQLYIHALLLYPQVEYKQSVVTLSSISSFEQIFVECRFNKSLDIILCLCTSKSSCQFLYTKFWKKKLYQHLTHTFVWKFSQFLSLFFLLSLCVLFFFRILTKCTFDFEIFWLWPICCESFIWVIF